MESCLPLRDRELGSFNVFQNCSWPPWNQRTRIPCTATADLHWLFGNFYEVETKAKGILRDVAVTFVPIPFKTSMASTDFQPIFLAQFQPRHPAAKLRCNAICRASLGSVGRPFLSCGVVSFWNRKAGNKNYPYIASQKCPRSQVSSTHFHINGLLWSQVWSFQDIPKGSANLHLTKNLYRAHNKNMVCTVCMHLPGFSSFKI